MRYLPVEMVLQIRRALSNGVSKTLTKAGLIFVVVLGIMQIALLATTNRLAEAFLASLGLPSGAAQSSTSLPLSLPVSAITAGVLAVVILLIFQIITIVLVRVMAADNQTITRESYTRRMGWVFLNSIAGSIIISILTSIGFALLVIPGLFLTVSLLFTVIYIADKDENFIDGMQDSWSLASGNRWRLFGLYLAVIIAFMIVSFVTGFILPATSVASSIVTAVLTTIMIVYMMAVLTDAYRQLRSENRSEQGTNSDPTTASV